MPVIDSVGVEELLGCAERYIGLGELYANGGDHKNARNEMERSYALVGVVREYVIDRGGMMIARRVKYDTIISRTITLRTRILQLEKAKQPPAEPNPLDFETPVAGGEDV